MNVKVWRFGDAEFDEPHGKLTVGGEAAELDRNCAAILGTLLSNAGREVAKERLLEAGWPDRIVHENSLAKAVSRLRRAMGTQGEALHTVYGRGYRLDVVATGKPNTATNGAAARLPGKSPAARGARPGVLPGAVLAVGLLALGAANLDVLRPAGEQEAQQRPLIVADAPDAIGRILWVDDHPPNNALEKRFFEDHRIAVHQAVDTEDAMSLLAMYDYDVLISDMGRGDDRLAGVHLIERLRRDGNMIPVMIYTVRPDREEQRRAQRELAARSGAQGLAVTPREIHEQILRHFGNPPPREEASPGSRRRRS